jgi:hypothetical protein
MDRYQPRNGSGLIAWQHIQFQQDAAQKTLANAFDDYIAITDSFYVQGGEITEAPVVSATDYTITAGVVCIRGEFMPLDAGAVTKAASQVVYLIVQDVGVDVYPDANTDGQVDYVMRDRKAIIQVGVAYPADSVSINIARKSDLDMARLKGRVVPKGGILPYFGPMNLFTATGKGLVGTAVEGWAVCNGLNDTIDMRGMVPLGATNVPSSGAGSVYGGVMPGPVNAGDAVGGDMVQLDANNLPAHNHPYVDRMRETSAQGSGVDTGGGLQLNAVGPTYQTGDNATTNDPIDVRQASRALVFIQSVV